MPFATKFIGEVKLRFQTLTNTAIPLPVPTITVTTAYTLLDSNESVRVDATAAPVTITVINPVLISGQKFNIKKIDASVNAVTISGATIDGVASTMLSAQNDGVTLQSNGTTYDIISRT